MFGNSVNIVAGLGQILNGVRVSFRNEVYACAALVLRGLRLTCTTAIRGSRNSRFRTMILPVLNNFSGLCCHGLLCATIAQTGGLVIVIKSMGEIGCVVSGGHHAGQCAYLGGVLGRSYFNEVRSSGSTRVD